MSDWRTSGVPGFGVVTMTGSRDPVIVGVGESASVGDVPGKKEDVDGVLTNDSYLDYHVRHAMTFAEYFGISTSARMVTTIPLGSGASSGLFLRYAAQALRSGECEVVLAASADNFLSGLKRSGAVQALANNRDKEFEAPYGPILPACFGLVAQRHMHQYGTTPEQLASVAVTMRHHASLNPRAHVRTPISVEDVLASRPVASPFTVLMCSLISDGGAAVVITTRERAMDLHQPMIDILGMGLAYGSQSDARIHSSLSQARSLVDIGTERSATEALGMAGVSRDDIDFLMVYDCFAIMPILFVEAAGFCSPGEGGAFFAEGRGLLGQRLPVNPHGGMMSYAHPGNPGGLFMFVEAVRQLRGAAVGRQVDGAELAMVTGYGGQMAMWPVTVLGRSR
jgi:acetyl-CoA acetyltransferase